MTKTRLEAFTDGVMAIIITIMVLELKTPPDTSWVSIKHLLLVLASYLNSFIIIGVYWGNHHHLFHTVEKANSKIMWANMHLLFWLSLIPFATAWVGATHFKSTTIAVYSALQVVCGLSYFILLRIIMKTHKHSAGVELSLKKQMKKGKITTAIYLCSVPLSMTHPIVAAAIYFLVTLLWLIPDRNIERALEELHENGRDV